MNLFWTENIIKDYRGTFIRCKNCKTETRIHSPEKTELFFCPKCQWLYSKENADYNKIGRNKKAPFHPTIPLQSQGEIEDVKYTVVGCVNKYEKGDKYARWEEYTLVDENSNCAFLSQSYGHWVFLKERTKPENFDPKSDKFPNDDTHLYELFSSYYQVTNSAVGEFYDDVVDVKKRFTKEYISPPNIFSYELNGAEASYLQGYYMRPKQIAKCFKDASIALPVREGIGSCQPFYLGIQPKRFTFLSILFLLITLPFYFVLQKNTSNTSLASLRATLTDSVRSKQIISPTFEINSTWPALLRIDSYSPVDNDWVEAEINLVNEKDGKEKSFVSGLEYYHGYEDGESWTEGEISHSNYLSNIKPGKYFIEANFFGSQTNRYTDFQITVYKDSPTNWNYALLMISLGVICAILILAESSFEKKRFGISNDE